MRLPRVRFSLGMLLFAVAVVAANCWAFQVLLSNPMSSATISGGRAVWHRIMPAETGLLPLANVALVGACLVAAQWVRSLRRRRETDPRPPAALTYFSVQLLALIILFLQLFRWNAVPTLRNAFETITSYAAWGWTALFGVAGESIPWLVFQSALLGVIVSGPPLLLGWIGRRLARRCATTLPRPRFLALAGLVSLDFAIAGLAICMTPRPFWDVQEIPLDFRVVDEDSGRPVAQAFVCLTDLVPSDTSDFVILDEDEGATSPRAFTDAAGRARLTARFVARGERNVFQIMGTFSPWGRWLAVSAEGRRTRHIPLTEVLGADGDPTWPPSGAVALARGGPPEESFRDLAGTFMSGGHGFGGSAFTIERDGRFEWNDWGCTHHTGEYGNLRRRGAEIEPVPIPHPGRAIDPAVTSRYRAVAWGDRLYLGLADDRELGDFCRMALGIPVSYGIYRRVSDGDEPPTGLPRLPTRVWATFLADTAGDAAKGARRALGSLVPGILRRRGAEAPGPLPALPGEAFVARSS